MAINIAGAPGGGAGFWLAGAVSGQKSHSGIMIISPHGVSVLWDSPDKELFLGCLGAVYWNDSFP